MGAIGAPQEDCLEPRRDELKEQSGNQAVQLINDNKWKRKGPVLRGVIDGISPRKLLSGVGCSRPDWCPTSAVLPSNRETLQGCQAARHDKQEKHLERPLVRSTSGRSWGACDGAATWRKSLDVIHAQISHGMTQVWAWHGTPRLPAGRAAVGGVVAFGWCSPYSLCY